MSSPRRAAKDALDRAAKAVRAARPAKLPAKPQAKPATDASAEAKRLAAALERGIAAGQLDVLSTEALQELLAAACRVYAARRESGEELAAVKKNALSATDVMVTASGLLRAADLAAFELGMWQGWTGR
jgi:hypothetical protein